MGGIFNINSTVYPPNVYNLSPQFLKNWRKAKAKVKAGTANARVLFIGDSTTFGGNSAGAWITPNITSCLATALSAQGITATDNSFCGCSVAGATTGSRLGTDPRIVKGSWTASFVADYTLGGSILNISSGATPLTFTPAVAVDTFKFIWQANGANGSIQIVAGGGTPTTIPANTGGGLTTTTVTNTLGVQALSATYQSGSTFYAIGVEAYNSAVKSVNIMNAGFWGTVVANWSTSSQQFSPLQTLGYIAPDLTVITPGINDWGASTSVSSFTSNLQLIITKAQLSGDVILMTPTPNNTNQSIQPNYINALYQLAAANNCVLVDNYARWVSYAVSNPLGLYSDTVHPTNVGYEDQASTLARVLIDA